VHEPDGGVIRARLIGKLARSLKARMLAPGIAYLTSDEERRSPFAHSFRARGRFSLDVRLLAPALRERGIGTLLRPKLKLKGPESATLMLTRAGWPCADRV
jgi:hypothetical protein